jgi:CPA2 family monovalent cation:H+ antiporter-2
MHEAPLLQDLATIMIVAGIVTLLCHRLKQPVVLGYIIAGVLIGPHTPPYALVHDEQTIKNLSELGVVFLMFSLGLEFNLGRLKAVGATAFIAASFDILLMFAAGYQIGRWFSWSAMDSLFLGAILSVSSTTIIVKALTELGKTRERFAELIFGILIVEDILAIVMIALLSGIALTGSFQAAEVGATVGRLGIFLVVALVVGLIMVPRLLTYVARHRSHEMLLVTTLGLCFGISLLAVKLGYSVALGAFLIGAVIAETKQIHQVERLLEPVRDMFSAVFFVSIGLLIEPAMLFQYATPIAVITLVVIVGKVLSCSLGTFLAGHDERTAMRVGMGMAQIGEFSFIIASLGLSLNVTSKFLYPIAVTVSAITTLLAPYLIKSSDAAVALFDRSVPKTIASSLSIYTRWVGGLNSRQGSVAGKFIRKWILQMLLSGALVAGLFVAATYLAFGGRSRLPELGLGETNLRAALWLGAALLSLPMLYAIVRKLQALGMLVAEVSVTRAAAGENTASLRTVVGAVVFSAGIGVLAVALLVLSSALLPPLRLLLIFIPAVALVAVLLRRQLVRVYAGAQIALKDSLTPIAPAPAGSPSALSPLLQDAHLDTTTVGASSPAVGKTIADLQLRSTSGASIVAIERGGTRTINPGPDARLEPGDVLLLLGDRQQLDAAVALVE